MATLLRAVKKLPEHSHVSQWSSTWTTAHALTLNTSPSIQFKGNHRHFYKVDVVETCYVTLGIFYYVLQNNVLDSIYWVWYLQHKKSRNGRVQRFYNCYWAAESARHRTWPPNFQNLLEHLVPQALISTPRVPVCSQNPGNCAWLDEFMMFLKFRQQDK